MRRLKLSKYLIFVNNKDGDLIVYSTLYNNLSLIKKDKYKFFTTLLQNINEARMTDTNYLELLNNNIVCFEDVDEEKIATDKYDSVIDSKEQMSIIILPTEKCNFRCIYCYEDFKGEKMSTETMSNIVKFVEHKLRDHKSLFVSWFGGEPLLAMDAIRSLSNNFLEKCKKAKKSYIAGITTNGYLLNVDTIRELISLHVLNYQITIDGNEKTHNINRPLANGSHTYDRILKNLLEIKQKVKTSTIQIIIRVNVTKSISQFDIDQLVNLFIDDKRFVFNIQKANDYSGENHHLLKDMGEYFEMLCCTKNQMNEIPNLDNTICYATKNNAFVIRSDGTLCKCTVHFSERNNICNINEKLDWNLIDNFKFCNCNSNKDVCKNCIIFPLCLGNKCPASNEIDCIKEIKYISLCVKNQSQKAKLIKFDDSD